MCFDLLVIGSGPSGVHAASACVDRGYAVGMLDVGVTDDRYDGLVPERPFHDVRRTDPAQHVYFLGDDPAETLRRQARAGVHLTPPRQYMVRDADALFPLRSETFVPLQSTGRGGLGIGWGANCFAYEDAELDRIGIPASELRPFYDEAAREVGISGPTDDALAPFIANLDPAVVQPPVAVDANAAAILRRYRAREARHAARGFYVGQGLLAMLSRPAGGRRENPRFDLDFWADIGRSVYRPQYTLERLRTRPNFQYLGGRLAVRFEEDAHAVTVHSKDVAGSGAAAHTASRVLLAGGAINSARLALASARPRGVRLPLLCNPNTWIAAINLAMLGRPAPHPRHSLSQLIVLMRSPDHEPDAVVGHIYSYRSLLLSRLLKDLPLPPRLGLRFLRLVSTALTIVNVHVPDRPSPHRWLELDGDGALRAEAGFTEEERRARRRAERRLAGFLARLGCLPLRAVRAAHGASIHYAGTLPCTQDDRPFTTDATGRLRGTSRVYVADGSSWRALPAKGPTLTLMANARRVASAAMRGLDAERPR